MKTNTTTSTLDFITFSSSPYTTAGAAWISHTSKDPLNNTEKHLWAKLTRLLINMFNSYSHFNWLQVNSFKNQSRKQKEEEKESPRYQKNKCLPPQVLGLGGCLVNVSLLVSDAFGENFFTHHKKSRNADPLWLLWGFFSEHGLKSMWWSHMCLKFDGCSGLDLKQLPRAKPNFTLHVPETGGKHMAFQNCMYHMAWSGLRKGHSLILPNQQWKQMWDHRILEASGMWKKNKLFLTFYSLNSIQNYFTSVC